MDKTKFLFMVYPLKTLILMAILCTTLLCFMPKKVCAEPLSDCMFKKLNEVSGETTINELRSLCEQDLSSVKPVSKADQAEPVAKRLEQDKENILKPFTLMAHRPNYILVAAHNSKGYNSDLFQLQYNDPTIEADDTEAQFQISVKTPLAIDLFNTFDIYAAYTNRSFWQLYNNDRSSPFRETNHEPEAWLQFNPEWSFLGFSNTANSLGINHQSNGRGGVLSRSWNRIFANFVIERGSFALAMKPWYRIKEDAEDDDNPDITDYLGHYEIRAGYKYQNNVFALMSRNNIESGFEKGALELSWSFPLGNYPYLKGYVQWFSGYGESLIDYNQYVNKIGFGLALTDWL
ncbi:MAG: phospholipase A [Desulfuromonadales bacterium]|jgi:phospholipase A1/A2